jgi:hypothetical protein
VTSCYSDAPWIQGFESSTSIPTCWTTTSTSTNYSVATSGLYPSCTPHSGTNMLYFNSFNISANNYAVLYTPLLFLNGSAVGVSYWQYRDPGYSGTDYAAEGVEVFYNTTASLTGATSLGFTARAYTTAGWYNITYTIPAGLTGSAYIMFKTTSKYGNNQFIDDININYLTTSCSTPSAMTVSNIGTTTADIAWTPAGTETAWILKYKEVSATSWTVVNATSSSYTLTNLNPSATYEVSVKASCGAGQYSGYITKTFDTKCNPLVVLPYVEDFEAVAVNGFPYCFEKITTGNAYVKVVQMTGTKGIEMSTGGVETSMLILPSTQAYVNTLRLKFKYDGGANYKFKFGYITNINDASTFVTLKEDSLTNLGWYYYDLFTSNTLTGTERMAVVFNMGSGYSARLDSVTLMLQPACYEPINLSINSFALTSAVLNWAYPTTSLPTNYTVNYRLVGDTTWIVKANVARPYTLTGLTKNNIYEFRVKANCTGDGSDWSSTFTFRTQYQVLYTQSFNTPTLPFAWTNIKTAGSSTPGIFDFQTSGTYPTCTPKAGTYMARFNSFNISSGGVAELSTPQILGMGEGSLIKFWMYRDGGYLSYTDRITVIVKDSINSVTPTSLLTVNRSKDLTPTVSANGWYQYIARVPSTGFNYVVFQATSACGNNMFIDEIEVTAPVYIPVTIVNGTNGTSSPTGTVSVLNGTNKVINFTPAVGYRVASITVNGNQVQGSDVTNSRPFVFTQAVGLDTLTINTTYEKIPYTITPSITNFHGANYLDNGNMPGTITPNTPTIVLHGGDTTFTININPHFHLYRLMVDGVSAPFVSTGNNTFTYTFNNVILNHTIQAVLKIDTIAIEYTVSGGTGILDGVTVVGPAVHSTYVNYGDDLFASMPAAPGYENISTTVNGQFVGAATQYQLYDIMTTQHINVVYAPKTINITTQAFGNGTVTAGTSFSYTPAFVYNYTAVPATGYYISAVLVNDVPVTVTNPMSFAGQLTNITDDKAIKVYFEPLTFDITATCGLGGTILPNGGATYNYGVSQNYVITAEIGYTIASIVVDGTPVTVPANATAYTHSFNNITANHTIAATFAINIFTITATIDANGSVSPAGVTTVNYNGSQVYSITPTVGYHILNVLIDGISMGPIDTYTFANVMANHTIAATFAINTYTLTASINGNGTITPAGTTTVNYGENQTYNIAVATGSTLVNVFVDGVSQGAVTTYTFTNVTENHTIQAITNAANYTVSVIQPANGVITPGTQVVNYGATPSFTVTPNTGYMISTINVNSTPVAFTPNIAGIATITLPVVSANATVTATMIVKTFTITATTGQHGTINPSGVTTLNYGTQQTYTFNPSNGYEVEDVIVDGISAGAMPTFQFVNVTANHTIRATFQLTACDAPINTFVTNIEQTTAKLNWNNTGATTYAIQYKALDDANYTLVNNVTANEYQITGLTVNTYYIWQVKANCTQTNNSDWSVERGFTTLPVGHDGVNDQDLASVQVYSNMSNIYIINKEGVQITNAAIYDMYGKLIYTGNVIDNPTVISLDAATGIYIVRLSTENGTATYKVHITK